MAAKNAIVTLRNGVTRAVLPSNITMIPGKNYLISLDELRKFSRKVRETVIEVTNIGTTDTRIPRRDNGYGYIDLDNLAGTAAEWKSGYGYKLGDVVQGLNGSAFKLVKFVGDDFLAGAVMVWTDKAAGEVGASETGEFAGIATANTDDGYLSFVQVEGTATVSGTVSVGDTAAVTSSAGVTGGTASTPAGRLLGTVLSSAAGDLEVALRNDRARGRHTKRPNLFLSSDF